MKHTTRRTLYLPVMIAAAVAVACALALSAVSEKAQATFSGKNGKIAYAAEMYRRPPPRFDYWLYTTKPGGGKPFQLIHNDSGTGDPDFSPNGKRIAYSASDGNDSEIYTIKATGGEPFQVTHNNINDHEPSYSPDGKKIAYSCARGRPPGFDNQLDYELCTINATGGETFQLTHNTRDEYDPDYSPNGKKIAFHGIDREGDSEIFTINVGGGGRAAVTDDSIANGGPSYSPDGKRLAFDGYDRRTFLVDYEIDYEIYTIKVGGGGRRNLTDTDFKDEFDPDYSPNGKKIAYSGPRITGATGTGYEIYTINAGGGGKTRVTHNNTADTSPSWGRRP